MRKEVIDMEKLKRIPREGVWHYIEVVPEGHFVETYAEWHPHATLQVRGIYHYPYNLEEKKGVILFYYSSGDPFCYCGSIEEADRIVSSFFRCEVMAPSSPETAATDRP